MNQFQTFQLHSIDFAANFVAEIVNENELISQN
jgi:hypothetical protein